MGGKANAKKPATRKKAKRRKKPAAYFLSLTVENVRCFGPKQTLDLSDGHGRPARWTVLLGDNGAGKTTLLECLALLEPGPAERDRDGSAWVYPRIVDGDRASPSRWNYQRYGTRQGTISCEVYEGAGLCGTARNRTAQIMRVTIKLAEGGISPSLPQADTFSEFAGVLCHAYGAGRRMRSRATWHDVIDDRCATLFFDESSLGDAEDWLLEADHQARYSESEGAASRTRLRRRRDAIIEILTHLLPDVHDVRIAEVSQDPNTVKLRVQFLTDDAWVFLDDLSLGYRTMVAWVVDLARRLFDRNPQSPDPLAEPAVVLLDEIDLHMHPKWQRNIMQYLTERFPNTQFIVTAHSPLVAQAAGEDANVAVLRRKGDHVEIDNEVQAIRGWRVDQVLTSDLFELKTARPPQIEAALEERKRILGKSRLTKKDRERLAELEEEIGYLPTAETKEDIEAMALIRRVAEEVKARGEAPNGTDQ